MEDLSKSNPLPRVDNDVFLSFQVYFPNAIVFTLCCRLLQRLSSAFECFLCYFNGRNFVVNVTALFSCTVFYYTESFYIVPQQLCAAVSFQASVIKI